MPAALISLSVALLLDLMLGDPPNRFHPVAVMGAFISWAEKLYKGRTSWRQFIHGMLLVLAGGFVFFLIPFFLMRAFVFVPEWAGWIITGVLLKPMLAWRRLIEAGLEVRKALMGQDLSEARRLVSWHLVSRDCSDLSSEQVASAVVESLAENLTDSFSAPIAYFLLLGLPVVWVYRFVNTADALIGYRTPQYEYLGKFTARLDDGLNWLPARLAGVSLVLSAWMCRLDAGEAWRVMLAQHGCTSSPNAGWTMAAAAGALEVRLEKGGHYRLNGEWPLPGAKNIRQACRLVSIAALF